MSFWVEIRRRNVFKVGVAYLIVAWLIAQIVSVINDPLNLPEPFDTIVILMLALGFPVALVFAWAYELTPQGLRPTSAVPVSQSMTAITGRRLNSFAIVALSIAVIVLVIDNYILTDTGRQISIAVLPFENLSSDEQQEYFADGLTEEFISALTRVPDIRVTPRPSAFALKGRALTVPEIADVLGVDYVLDGSVQKANETLRISARLTRADEELLWNDSYNRQLEDVFAIQEEIASAVVGRLSSVLGLGDVVLFPGGTDNFDAFDHYLSARSIAATGTADNSAIAEYERAISLDPDFVLARIGLATEAYRLLAVRRGDSGWESYTEQAVNDAVAVGPEFPETLWLVAQQNIDAHDWISAMHAMQEMVSRSTPSDYNAHSRMGMFLTWTGLAAEAVPFLERAQRLDPSAVVAPTILAIAHDALGNHEEAIGIFERARELPGYGAPVYNPQVWRLVGAGNVEGAIHLLEEDSEDRQLIDQLSDRQRGLADARDWFEAQPDVPFVAGNVAQLAGFYGDTELSIQAWRVAIRSPGFLMFLWTPLSEPVRRHPGFIDLMRDINLDDYWREYGWPEHCRLLEHGSDEFECN